MLRLPTSRNDAGAMADWGDLLGMSDPVELADHRLWHVAQHPTFFKRLRVVVSSVRAIVITRSCVVSTRDHLQ